MRRIRENPQLLESGRDDRQRQPGRQRRREQRVGLGERGRPRLETAVGELRPARQRNRGYLFEIFCWRLL